MENKWQLIETAPIDAIIYGFDIKSKRNAKVFYNGNNEWEEVDSLDRGMAIGFYPTHWMPLPEPPVE